VAIRAPESGTCVSNGSRKSTVGVAVVTMIGRYCFRVVRSDRSSVEGSLQGIGSTKEIDAAITGK
jgi:hypothetical protein